jgi:hypothetical protein
VKALFIPLKRQYFEDFRDGRKDTEYRPYGPRWNEKTCPVGRPVVLSLGYGKGHRLVGRVAGFATSEEQTKTDAWRDCYGDKGGLAACIHIRLNDGPMEG